MNVVSPLVLLSILTLALPAAADALLPDMQTVVPLHLQLVNRQQREILRFSNGIANTGAGPWQMRPEVTGGDLPVQKAIQQLLDENGDVAAEVEVSQFEFHPEHNHWHIAGVALFEVRDAAWEIVGDNSIKTTFCLIDWYMLEGNSPNVDRTYSECNGATQGISPGWVDQYHQATEGQDLDITGAPEGLYYLVSTSNSDQVFVESDYTNNTSWVSFELTRDSKGNPKIELVDSWCPSEILCRTKRPNR